jgi:acetyltransferase
MLYMESVKNARKFMSATRGFARAKPIIVIKAGKFPESAEAAICHTGALCGEDAVYDAAFQRAGIVRVQAIGDLFNCAEALSMQPRPKGPRLTIVTNAGGPGIMATDALISRGGQLSPLSTKTIRALKELLPPYCSNLNPIDILEEATTDRFRTVLNICFNDPNSDGFLVIYTPQGASNPVETAKAISNLSENLRKPLLTCWMGEDDCWKARKFARKNGIPAFAAPEQAVSTFMYMWSYAQNLQLLYETPEELSVELSIPTYLREVLRKAVDEDREVLTEPESSEFLHAYKIPTAESVTATSLDAAVSAASKIGFPLAMKILSPQVRHKMRAGGVFLDVRSEAEVEKVFQELSHRFDRLKPRGLFEGVVLQPMVKRRGYEILIGAKKDPHFGSVILFGTGGTATELFRDVNIGLPPLNQVLARRLIERTAIYRFLMDREGSCVNQKLLEETLVRFSQLVIDFPEIREITINPLMIDGDGVAAVDTRIEIDKHKLQGKAQPHEHLVIAPYPLNYSFDWKLKDGRKVAIRPIKPEDEHLLDELFQSFSDATMRFRFFQLVKEMSHDMLTRCCNIDYDREVAMIAECGEGTRKIIGVSRLILQPDGKHGEFAVAVGDRWQGLGLGSKLVDSIIQIGRGMGLESISGDVMTENLKMIQLCRTKGFKIQQLDEELVKATLDLQESDTNAHSLEL